MRKARKTNVVKYVKETLIVPVRMVIEYDPNISGAREAVHRECRPHQDSTGYSVKHGGYSAATLAVIYDQITVEKPKKGRRK